MDEPNTPPPPVLFLPSDRAWLDPPLVGRNLYTKWADAPTDPAVSVRLADNNPLRWAVGFVYWVNAGNLAVAPWPLDSVHTWGWELTGGSPLWFHLHTFGPLAMGEWYSLPTSGSVVRVIEVIRRA